MLKNARTRRLRKICTLSYLGKEDSTSSTSKSSSSKNQPTFESDMLAACQYKLENLKYPYASLDLNDPFVLAQSIGFCERHYIKALNSKRRKLVAQYTTYGTWNRNFTKYLVCLKCPEHVIDAKLALRARTGCFVTRSSALVRGDKMIRLFLNRLFLNQLIYPK